MSIIYGLIALSLTLALILNFLGSSLIVLALFFLALSILIAASNKFIELGAKIGKSIGLSNYLIGVILMGFGTSTPELITGIISSYNGDFNISYFNILGSNISNILLILGVAILLMKGEKITVQTNLLKTESLYLFLSAVIPIILFLNQTANSILGIIPVFMFLVYLFINLKNGNEQEDNNNNVFLSDWLLLIVSIGLIIIGAEYTIKYLKESAIVLNIGVDIISVILLAIGTSLPELVSSIILIRKGSSSQEMLLGNIIGSNIFNALMILGVSMLSSFAGGFNVIELTSNILDISLIFLLVSTIILILMYLDKEIYYVDGIILVLSYILFLSMIL